MPLTLVVCVKQIPNPDRQFQIAPGGLDIRRETLNYKVNGADEYALEAAVRLKEKHGGRVVAITAGPERAETGLREALAEGAGEGAPGGPGEGGRRGRPGRLRRPRGLRRRAGRPPPRRGDPHDPPRPRPHGRPVGRPHQLGHGGPPRGAPRAAPRERRDERRREGRRARGHERARGRAPARRLDAAARPPHDPVRRERAAVRAPPRDHEGLPPADQGGPVLGGLPPVHVQGAQAHPAPLEAGRGADPREGGRTGEAPRAALPREGLRPGVTGWARTSSSSRSTSRGSSLPPPWPSAIRFRPPLPGIANLPLLSA